MTQLPNVLVRILPNERAHAGINGAFTVLRRPEGDPVVFLENLTSSLFLEERHEIERYEYATRELLSCCLDAAQSVQHIAALFRALDEEGSLPDEQHRDHLSDLAQEQL